MNLRPRVLVILALLIAGLPSLGWAAQEEASGAGTTTGGQPIPGLHAVTFVNTHQGWVGGHGVIAATIDGGATWVRQYAGDDTIVRFTFLNAVDGWALGTQRFMGSNMGGQHWGLRGQTIPALIRVSFISRDLGWGITGQYLHETDFPAQEQPR